MALVRQIQELNRGRGRVHNEIDCTCSIFEEGGHAYIQLDTYGSNTREIPGKVSQSMQFDRAGALQLIRLIERAFPDLAR